MTTEPELIKKKLDILEVKWDDEATYCNIHLKALGINGKPITVSSAMHIFSIDNKTLELERTMLLLKLSKALHQDFIDQADNGIIVSTLVGPNKKLTIINIIKN